METLGDLWDRLSILDIRIRKHPDVKVKRKLRKRRELIWREFYRRLGALELGELAEEVACGEKYKLRRTPATVQLPDSLTALKELLARTNEAMWDNEDVRDNLMWAPTKGLETLINLRDADRREQQLNQDRSALIDAINDCYRARVEPKARKARRRAKGKKPIARKKGKK